MTIKIARTIQSIGMMVAMCLTIAMAWNEEYTVGHTWAFFVFLWCALAFLGFAIIYWRLRNH